MSQLSVTTGDTNCRYLAAPESCSSGGQFGRHVEALGIKLPSSMSLRTLVRRGWIRPRLRVGIPVRALQSWSTFPNHPIQGEEACPEEDMWGLEVWSEATCPTPELDPPTRPLWMHWLDDPTDGMTALARRHAVDPARRDSEPAEFVHTARGTSVLPWIDFFADWQAYHLAELVRMAEFTVHGVTDSFESCATHVQHHTAHFDARAKQRAELWEERGTFFDLIACYRTILARCCMRDNFDSDVRDAARVLAEQRGIDAAAVRTGIREVLLSQWQRWDHAPPVRGTRLLRRLQQDIQYATHLLRDLTDQPVDPFHPCWFARDRSPRPWAPLVKALPYEEWLARRDFPTSAVQYQGETPHPFRRGEEALANLIGRHWPECPPLRRFCLAWVRLHEEMRGRDRDLPANLTIAADERIEQFNLVGLHTERLLRHILVTLGLVRSRDGTNDVLRIAASRALERLVPPAQVSEQCIGKLIRDRSSLRDTPDLGHSMCYPALVRSGDEAADQVVAAHVNALILRNYAAHHDYLDDALIYPNRDATRPHAGATLLSSCLLVVIAALHSLPAKQDVARP